MPMNTLTALRLDRDRELSADIVPEAYFRCQAIRELSYPWATRNFERQLTEVRAAWTDKFLYIHLWAKDSWITAEVSKPKDRFPMTTVLRFSCNPKRAGTGDGRSTPWNPSGLQS